MLREPVSVRSADPPPEILLVDDDATFCDTLRMLLDGEGFTVVTERTLVGATNYLSSAQPDLLITDIRLDDGNGWNVAKYANQQYPMLPIVVVTGFCASRDDAEAEYARVPVFLKPFDPEDLLAYIRVRHL